MSSQMNMLLPMGLYLCCMLGIGIYVHRSSSQGQGSFLEHYFIGDRGDGVIRARHDSHRHLHQCQQFYRGPRSGLGEGVGVGFSCHDSGTYGVSHPGQSLGKKARSHLPKDPGSYGDGLPLGPVPLENLWCFSPL